MKTNLKTKKSLPAVKGHRPHHCELPFPVFHNHLGQAHNNERPQMKKRFVTITEEKNCLSASFRNRGRK
jgi:hypothetical protein